MKKLILILLCLPFIGFGQDWVDMMQDPNTNFYQTQSSFNDFWEGRTIEKGKGWKQFKRWENFIEQRVYPDGNLQPQILFEENQNLNSRNDNFRDLMPENEILESVKTELDYGDGEVYPAEINSADITAYNIKGMWYFDKRRGELMYRLLGIQPLGKDITNPDDELKNTKLFWIWYPSIRKILHTELVFNDTSNSNRISFDQLLLSRRFSSYIFKEDNLYNDRAIEAYKRKGLDYILESQRIKDEILNFEQDLWNR